MSRRARRIRRLRKRIRRQRRRTMRLHRAEARARKALGTLRRRYARLRSRRTWHPEAEIVSYASAGSFIDAGRKIVWHTTEGTSLPRYEGSAPHFTLDPRSGQLWQHIPLNRAARTLKHTRRPETNRAHAIQVEVIGFAADTPDWPEAYYDQLAALARWIEWHARVPRRCNVEFEARVHHISDQRWVRYAGHIGHQHVPQNDHWDPGALRIDEVLDR